MTINRKKLLNNSEPMAINKKRLPKRPVPFGNQKGENLWIGLKNKNKLLMKRIRIF